MPEVKHASVWYPPQFPLQGRLPSNANLIHKNIECRRQRQRNYQDELSLAAGRRVMPPCSKSLHISLFFDGTGNNLNNDVFLSSPRQSTNITRLFRASIGEGLAGGTGHNEQARYLTDAAGTGDGEHFKYYMPGVGTPFAEVGDLDYTRIGQGVARYGEERINWALMMIIDALRRTLKLPRQNNAALLAAVKAMGTLPGLGWVNGERIRRREFDKQLALLATPLRIALSRNAGQCQLLGISLYVYGFSRGATAARAFVSWLNGLLSKSVKTPTPSLAILDLKLPISVEYLGLMDSVASVGLPDSVPGVDGHMSWADGNQALPEGELVKRCLHIVASHEQRLSFPLESIRREGGDYPTNSVEVIYPGVHSDQGGGYPAGYQGKAYSLNNNEEDTLLLSQIALNDLYADAFKHGAPLKAPKDAMPRELHGQLWRVMAPELILEFIAAPTLINRFNAWREVTLGLPPAPSPLSNNEAARYKPLPANDHIEQALRSQMAWISAWRIDRYAFASLHQTPFYRQASDIHADPARRKTAELEQSQAQRAIKTRREQQLGREHMRLEPAKPLEPGLPGFEPDLAQTQLREAAEEFGADFGGAGVMANVAAGVARLGRIPGLLAHSVTAEARREREQMRSAGMTKIRQLFPLSKTAFVYRDELKRGDVDESLNAAQPEGLLRALFDDQVHDSRAAFLHSLGREQGGSYFTERMVFFGDANRRDLALYGENDQQMQASNANRATTAPLMDAEQLAQVHKKIDAVWDAHTAQTGGVTDAQA